MNKKQKCYIWGAGNLGQYLIPWLEDEGIEIIAFIDNDTNKWATWNNLIPVYGEEIAINDILGNNAAFVIVAIKNISDALEVAQHLYNRGIEQIKLAPDYLRHYDKSHKKVSILEELQDINCVKPEVKRIDVDVSNICNLNCKGCGHVSNVIDKSEAPFMDIGVYEKDIKKLHELYSAVKYFNLLGGEPLLNGELEKYILIFRDYFPQNEVRIITNGLLIRKMSQKLVDIVRRNNIIIEVSLYPPTYEQLFEIEKFLQKNSLRYILGSNKIEYFSKRIIKPENFVYREWRNVVCACHDAHQLSYGKLYGCPAMNAIKKLNRQFNLNVNEEADDVIDLYDFTGSGWDINKKFSKQYDTCDWCSVDKPVFFKWESGGEISQEDWFV